MPNFISMEVKGAKQTAKRLTKPLTSLMNKNFSRAAKILQQSIQRAAPKKTGKYSQTIRVKQSGAYQFTITDGFPGQILRHGARPHIIVPKNKKALYWPGLEHPVAMVNHPGFKKLTYVEDGITAAQPQMNQLTKQFGENIVREIG